MSILSFPSPESAIVASARLASDNGPIGHRPLDFVMTPSRRKIYRTAAALRLLACLALLTAILFELAGCASAPPPTAEIGAADSAITIAATPASRQYAAAELATAHDELVAAQAAMAKQDYARARQFADAAHADADLANAKGRALAAQAAVAAKTQENEALRNRISQEPLP